jgi:hypothetical protein
MKTDKIYKLSKGETTLMEIDSKCAESALDYFMEFYPECYSDKEYKVDVGFKNITEAFQEKTYSSCLMNHQLK